VPLATGATRVTESAAVVATALPARLVAVTRHERGPIVRRHRPGRAGGFRPVQFFRGGVATYGMTPAVAP
jgi:hypothetical protein